MYEAPSYLDQGALCVNQYDERAWSWNVHEPLLLDLKD